MISADIIRITVLYHLLKGCLKFTIGPTYIVTHQIVMQNTVFNFV